MFNILKILKLGGFSTLKRIISFLSNNLLTFKQIFGDIVKEGVAHGGVAQEGVAQEGMAMVRVCHQGWIFGQITYIGFIVTFLPQ